MRAIQRGERAGASGGWAAVGTRATWARRLCAARAAAWISVAVAAASTPGCGRRSEPVRVEGAGIALEASLDPAVPRVGAHRLELELRDAGGRPVDAASVEVAVRMPAMGAMPAMGGAVPARARGEGRYEADFDLTMGGTWRLEVAVRPRGGALLRAEGSITTGSAGLALRGVEGAAAGATAAPATGAGHEGHGGGEGQGGREEPGGDEGRGGHEGHGAPAAPAGEGRAPGEAAMDAGGARSLAGETPGEFALPPARVQEVGVRAGPAQRKRVAPSIRAAGLVGYDEAALVDVSLKVRGWVGSLRADAVGVRVERGAPLFALYSPELYAAQEEYLQALHGQREARGTAVPDRADWRVRAARKRLALWDIGPGEIAAIERRGVPMEEVVIRSPVTGTVLEKDVVEGSAFEPGQRLLRIVPLDRVWVEAQVYESEVPLVRVGMAAEVSLPYESGRRFAGRVSFVHPTLSGDTRTLRLRVVLENPEGALRPGMWVTVRLEGEAAERLVVPQSAVLHAGDRAFVFLDLGGGRFRPREVEVGLRSGDDVEIARGLEAGQRIVTSGTFLIASESRLRAALEQW